MSEVLLVLFFIVLLYGVPEILRQMKNKQQQPQKIPPMPKNYPMPKIQPRAVPEQRVTEPVVLLQQEILSPIFQEVSSIKQDKCAKQNQIHDNIRQGILWAELMSPPLALRKRQRKYNKVRDF